MASQLIFLVGLMIAATTPEKPAPSAPSAPSGPSAPAAPTVSSPTVSSPAMPGATVQSPTGSSPPANALASSNAKEPPAKPSAAKEPPPLRPLTSITRLADDGNNDAMHSSMAPTAQTLCDELMRSSQSMAQERAKLTKDREALARERLDLEKLAKKVDEAREQLKTETDRLVSFIELADEDTKPNGAKYWSNKLSQANDPKAAGKTPLDMLAKTIKAMKPDQAAALIGRLDRHLAAALLMRMRPTDQSALMERLKPDQATELLETIAASNKP